MPEEQKPQTGTKTAAQIAGTMTLGGAAAVLTVTLLEATVGYQADANTGIALGVVWNAILGRAARYLT